MRSRYHDAYDLSTCYTGAKMEGRMTRMRCMNMMLCLVLLLSLSPRHTFGATTASAPPPQTISLDVQNSDVRDVLRLLAETGGVNILASGEVQGTITVRLID